MAETSRSNRITSTYRLQMRGDEFGFAQALDHLDYFEDLGVSHLYLSPILTATTGSTHGYDVTDPTSVSEALGGRTGFVALAHALRERGMGLVVDIVPNHLGIAVPQENRWWWDVLTHGRDSQYARYFDIDWRVDNGVDGKLALPILGSEADLAALTVDRSGARPRLGCHEHRFPIAPGTEGTDAAAVHDAQAYRLVPWDAGIVGYRRFFGVNELAAVRQEDPVVFEATHRELASWVAENLIDGVRVDHPDGLTDPRGYLQKLRGILGPDRLLVIEKILGPHEPLDPTLPIDGTTGYDALSDLGAVFVDRRGASGLTALSSTVTGDPGDLSSLAEQERTLKREVASADLGNELRRLARAVERESSPSTDRTELCAALADLVARTPVYRTDYTPLRGLLARIVGDTSAEHAPALPAVTDAFSRNGEAASRYQQVCGAVTAKAIEDRLFYRSARLVSLQEVGGNPGRFGITAGEYHLANAQRAGAWPRTMTTLSTHDTKRGEDVRARIGVLSQVPELWAQCVTQWERRAPSPDPATGLFLWQNLFGVWPSDGRLAAATPGLRERLHAYAEKAVREAGTHTTWSNVDRDFESRLHRWLDDVIDGPVGVSVTALTAQLAPHGYSDALGQKLLHLCGPGIPDTYQGSQVWEDSLVDPDNRRLVDHRALRQDLETPGPPPVDAGRAKHRLVRCALRLRLEHPEYFVGGRYAPVFAAGASADHVLAFGRGPSEGDSRVVAVATRLSVTLEDTGWGDTEMTLPTGRWTDLLTERSHSGTVAVPELLDRYPVSLLHRAS